MSNEQALGHTPGPGGGLAILGKPRQLLAWGQAGQGPPLGREAREPLRLEAAWLGAALHRQGEWGKKKKTYEKKGLSCFLQMNGAAELHGLSSGLGTAPSWAF